MTPWQDPLRLSLDGLVLKAGERTLLQGLRLELAAGQRWVVLGPNGAGKSTLIATLAGLLRPAGGRLNLQGRALHDWPLPALAPWRAWCPPGWSDPFPLRVDEALFAVAQARGDDAATAEARLADLLRRFDLQALAAHDVGRLSSGERQRVALCAALMQDAPLLLLDEPSAHLDLAHQQLLVAALVAHAARGGLVVASLHDLNLAWSLATHALLFDGKGELWAGPREQVMTPPHLGLAFDVPIAEVEVCGERRFWIGSAKEAA